MTNERCSREDELLEALERNYVGAELAEHVATCESCHELHVVAGALLNDRLQAIHEAPVPSSGTMWWRMRVRHRHDAEATARRSLLIGQAVTLIVAITLVFSFFGADLAFAAKDVRNTLATVQFSTRVLLALGVWAVLAPLAGWVAVRQK